MRARCILVGTSNPPHLATTHDRNFDPLPADRRSPVSRLLSTLAIIWRLACPYFFAEDHWAGRALLCAVITIELSIVAINVMLNQWNNRFYNALQERNWDAFISELGFFCILATIYIVLAVYQL